MIAKLTVNKAMALKMSSLPGTSLGYFAGRGGSSAAESAILSVRSSRILRPVLKVFVVTCRLSEEIGSSFVIFVQRLVRF